jgi:integrase
MPLKRGLAPKWRKMFKGQIYYFRGDYDEALRQWRAKEDELNCKKEATAWDTVMGMATAPLTIRLLEVFAEQHPELLHIVSVEKAEKLGVDIYAERLALETCGIVYQKPTTDTKTPTVARAITNYLDRQRVKQSAGNLSMGRYEILRRCAEHFKKHVGGAVSVANLNAQHLTTYHTALMEMVNRVNKPWSQPYAKRYLGVAKQFVKWCWENEMVASLPRNMQSKDLAIADSPARIKTFSNEEIKILLDAAPDRTKLYLLLALNCGYTQKDISDLEQSQIDWKVGRITRKRSKTKSSEGVPTISYKLWAKTFSLLKKNRSDDPVRVLLNADGGQLQTERFNEDGKYMKSDNIQTAYFRLCSGKELRKKLPKKSIKPLKMLRKTSPSHLENSKYASCARWFLGHAPRSVADRNYIAPPQDYFDEAIKWLGRQYGIK